MSILQMSFSSAVMVLAVVILRALAMNRLPKDTFLILWGIVLIRLLVPFSVPSQISVYSWVERNLDWELRAGTDTAMGSDDVTAANGIGHNQTAMNGEADRNGGEQNSGQGNGITDINREKQAASIINDKNANCAQENNTAKRNSTNLNQPL